MCSLVSKLFLALCIVALLLDFAVTSSLAELHGLFLAAGSTLEHGEEYRKAVHDQHQHCQNAQRSHREPRGLGKHHHNEEPHGHEKGQSGEHSDYYELHEVQQVADNMNYFGHLTPEHSDGLASNLDVESAKDFEEVFDSEDKDVSSPGSLQRTTVTETVSVTLAVAYPVIGTVRYQNIVPSVTVTMTFIAAHRSLDPEPFQTHHTLEKGERHTAAPGIQHVQLRFGPLKSSFMTTEIVAMEGNQGDGKSRSGISNQAVFLKVNRPTIGPDRTASLTRYVYEEPKVKFNAFGRLEISSVRS